MNWGHQPNNPAAVILVSEEWRRVHDNGCRIGLINTGPGVYTWTRLDAHLAACAAKGAKVLYCFSSTPTWPGAGLPPVNSDVGAYGLGTNYPMDPVYAAAFVTALVTHCKGKVAAYELWNESTCTGFWNGTLAQLYAFCQMAYRIITTIDPAAKVYMPSATWGWAANNALTGIESYFQMGFQHYAHAVTFHGYLPTGLQDIASTINGIYALENKYGVPLPVIDTEWGGHNLQAIPAAQQRAWVQDGLLIRQQERLAGQFWYQWDNNNPGTEHGPMVDKAGTYTIAGRAMVDAYNSTHPLPAVLSVMQV